MFVPLIRLLYEEKNNNYWRSEIAASKGDTRRLWWTFQLYDVPYRHTATLAEWSVVTSEEVEKLIGAALNKTCQLDQAPTWLVKDMRRLLSPFISLLFSKSLTTGCFPQEFKEAVVRPLLKKTGLDASELKNYRSLLNLPFLSKLLEKVVQVRIQAFFDSNGLMPNMQSAYRRFQHRDRGDEGG